MSEEPADRSTLPLGVLCFIAFRDAEAHVMSRLHAAGFDDLTVAQARVAARIAPDGTRMRDLAEQARVTKQTGTALVDQLERRGYVERVPDPADQRGRVVRLSARGWEVCRLAQEAQAETDAAWQAHLGARRTRALRGALEALREVVDPWA